MTILFHLTIWKKYDIQKKTIKIPNQDDIKTDYLDGYQYKNDRLLFFPTAEGYVNAYTHNGITQVGYMLFNYVYSYTDHLGNIRLSYAKDPRTNILKILEQNHYYPFGLKHENYNSERKVFAKEEAAVAEQANSIARNCIPCPHSKARKY